jgi:hypothetical protein
LRDRKRFAGVLIDMLETTASPDDRFLVLERALTSRMPELLSRVADLLDDEWPDYATVLRSDTDRLVEASGIFVRRLIEMTAEGLPEIEDIGEAPESAIRIVFEHIGRVQCGKGRSLPDLMSAYQVGAHEAWRHVSATALELCFAPDVLAALGGAVFAFVHELSAASAHGYVLQQSQSRAAHERLREELSDLLLSDRAESSAIRATAAQLGWPVPERAAVVLVDPHNEVARGIVDRLDAMALPIRRSDLYGVIVSADELVASSAPSQRAGRTGWTEHSGHGAHPGPSGRLRHSGGDGRVVRGLRGAHAVVGHGSPTTSLASSARVARLALDLQQRGLLDGDPLLVSEHLDAVIALRDDYLITTLRAQVLQPLDALPEGARTRLAETLTAWLRHLGAHDAVARELHIHPQTVRYRLAQLRECYGCALDDPESRGRMFLALVSSSPH